MARSKITKKVKIRHRRHHRRNSTRRGGSPRTQTRILSPRSQEEKFIERLSKSDLKNYSIESVAALLAKCTYSKNMDDKVSVVIEDSSCGKARNISDLITLAMKSRQGEKTIDSTTIDKIFKDCMKGLDNLDKFVVLKLCIEKHFGTTCSNGLGTTYMSGGVRRYYVGQKYMVPSPRSRRSPGGMDCCSAMLLIVAALYIVGRVSDLLGY